jgi:hypothetical protein
MSLIPDKTEVQEQWNTFLYQPQYISVQYLQFKNHGLGSTPVQSYHDLMMPTQHVSKPTYSEIETTKRNAMSFAKTKIDKCESQSSNSCSFSYPCDHWKKFAPSPTTFHKFPKFKNPFGKIHL